MRPDVDRMHWRPECDDIAPIVGVTVGAVRVGLGDELSRAIGAAAALAEARREGGNRVNWNAVT